MSRLTGAPLRAALLCASCLCGVATLGACAGTSAVEGDSGVPSPPDLTVVDPVVAGKKLVDRLGCAGCHDPGDSSLSGRLTPIGNGRVFPSNLTPDEETGLGTWSDEEIATAIRSGVDAELAKLCPPMPHFDTLRDDEVAAIVAYLRHLGAVNKEIPGSVCPPIKGTVVDFPDAGTPGADLAQAMVPPDGGAPPDAVMVVTDMAVMSVDMAGRDLAGKPVDMASAPDLAKPPSIDGGGGDGGVDGGQPACHAVVNEVQTQGLGGATDEFIELYNPCSGSLDFNNVTLVYRSSAGVKDVTLLQFMGFFPSKSLFLCGGDGYFGLADAYYSPATSLASKGGGVGLRDAKGVLIDSVGYGDATNSFVRVAAAAAPGVGESIERLPDGRDSGDSSRDFTLTKAPTPRKSNK